MDLADGDVARPDSENVSSRKSPCEPLVHVVRRLNSPVQAGVPSLSVRARMMFVTIDLDNETHSPASWYVRSEHPIGHVLDADYGP